MSRGFVFSTLFILAGLSLTSCRETEFLHRVFEPAAGMRMNYSASALDLDVTPVDILWVIDNSASMSKYQNDVKQNTALFMDSFTKRRGLKWNMGLISSSEGKPPYIGFDPGNELNETTVDPVQKFQDAVSRLGTSGSGTEKFFVPTIDTLTKYPNFLRKRSVLAVFFITDAHEQSMDNGTNINSDDYLNFLFSLKDEKKNILQYGSFATADNGCGVGAGEEEWSYPGSAYEKVIDETHGKYYRLCDANFGQHLADFAEELAKRVYHPKMYLTKRPNLKTLKLKYAGVELIPGPKASGGQWVYDPELNAIVFHDLDFLDPNDEKVMIDIDYQEDNGFN